MNGGVNCTDSDVAYRAVSQLFSFMEDPTTSGNLTRTFVACNCTNWHSDIVNAPAIAIIRVIMSLFSVIGSASIILSVLLTGRLNTAEVHPIFILSVADFILAILWMIGGVVWLSPGDGGWASSESAPHTGMCYVLAVATTMAEIVTFMLTTVYATSALLRVKELWANRGRTLVDQDKRKKFRHVLTLVVYLVSWALPLIIVLAITESIIGIDETNKGCWCVIDFYNLRPDDGSNHPNSTFNKFAMIQATTLGVAFVLTTLVICVQYILTFYYARKVIHLQAGEEGRGPKMTKTILVRLSFFIAIYLLCGLPTFAASIAVWNEKERLHLSERPDTVILFIHAIFSPLQGFLNAIVYGWSRREFRRAVNLPRPGTRATPNRYESLNTSRSGARTSTLIFSSGQNTGRR